MSHIIYPSDGETVDTVFYPVVPDSFMRRRGSQPVIVRKTVPASEWVDDLERPIVAPLDPWSF